MNIKSFGLVFTVALTLAAFGCGKKEEQPAERPSAAAPAGAKVDAATAGSITGTVTLEGKPPALRPINMSAEPYCQKAHSSPVYPQDIVAGEKGALANVVIYVKDDLGKYSFDRPATPVVLDQRGCMYDPHIICLMAGQKLEVRNDDQTTHNIHPMPKDNREWNKSQAPGADPIEDTFARAELSIPVKCNIHPWMKSYVFVFKNPYYAVTSKSGTFELKGLPPGTYTIEAWHEKFGSTEQQVTLGPKESKAISFSFKAASSGD